MDLDVAAGRLTISRFKTETADTATATEVL